MVANRKYFEFVGASHDYRCPKCKGHQYLVQDLQPETGVVFLHSWVGHPLESLGLINMMHYWSKGEAGPACMINYKEIT